MRYLAILALCGTLSACATLMEDHSSFDYTPAGAARAWHFDGYGDYAFGQCWRLVVRADGGAVGRSNLMCGPNDRATLRGRYAGRSIRSACELAYFGQYAAVDCDVYVNNEFAGTLSF